MSLNLSWRQRLCVLVMLAVVAAVFVLDQPKASSSAHSTQASSYASEYTAPDTPVQDLHAARLHQARRLIASSSLKQHRSRPPAPVASAPPPAAPQSQAAPPAPSGGSLSAIQAYARSLVGSAQFGCLDLLWNRESGWNYQAENPSGAFGIPQALPGSKMAVAGADWQTNPYTQVRWGVVFYIDPIYGSACSAWAHEEASGWY